ncbi:MAG: hypothetical protein KF901_14360 [Myxococcales bacterium]|nr:hypothetical protein [Myxococcales bacterium]
MNRRIDLRVSALAFVATLLALSLAATTAAQAERDPTRIFPHEAAIEADARGLVRLPLRPDVLERARPDLSDLRVFDGAGHELPFLVDRGRRPWPADVRARVVLVPLDVRERDVRRLDPTSFQELRVPAPDAPPEGARWEIEVDSPEARFVRQLVVHWEDADVTVEVARGSVFRLPSPLRQRVRLPLPALPPPSHDARLVISILGEGPLLSPTLALVGQRASSPGDVLTMPLEIVSSVREGDRTIVELARPVGLVPERVLVQTRTATFHREVTVEDLRRGREPTRLGGGSVFRIDDLDAEALDVPLGRATGEALRVVLHDGDAPSLEALSFVAQIELPSLVFEHREGARLLFGGGRAGARRHDLERFAGTTLGEQVLERPLPEARLGATGDNPRFDQRPALGFATAGRAVPLARFSSVAALEVRGAREGSSHFVPSPALLALARDDLADLRVVDGAGNARPYVLSPADTRALIDVPIGAPATSPRRSRYAIPLDPGPLPTTRLELDPEDAFVSRPCVLYGFDERGERRRLASVTLARGPDDDARVMIPLPRERVAALELEVEDGDDSPLTFRGAWVEVVTRTVFVAAPDGDYRVLVGDPEAEHPRYALEDALELVLAIDSAPAALGAVERNPAHEPPPFWEQVDLASGAVWGVLLLAVVLLGGLTLRLARHAPDAPSPDATPNAPSPDATPPHAPSPDATPPHAPSPDATPPHAPSPDEATSKAEAAGEEDERRNEGTAK